MLWKREKQPKEITKSDLQEYLNNIPTKKYNYRNSIKAPILSYYNTVLDKKWKKLKIGRKDVTQKDILTHADFEKIIGSTKLEKARQMLSMMKEIGVRNFEARNAKITNLMPGNFNIRIMGKGNKERDIPMSSKAFTSLYNYALRNKRKNCDLIFPNKKNKPYSKEWLRSLVVDTANNAGIDKHITPHSYRRTFCTMIYYGNKKDLVLTSRLMGHANIN